MTDNFKEIGSLFGREGSGAGFVKQTDKESFTYAFAWPEGDTWATLTGYLNPEEQGIRAMLIATGEPPREVTLLPDKNGSTLKSLQALVGGNIETFDIAFGEEVSLYVNEEVCSPARQIVPSSPPRRWQKPGISPSSITRRSWRWGISTPF